MVSSLGLCSYSLTQPRQRKMICLMVTKASREFQLSFKMDNTVYTLN